VKLIVSVVEKYMLIVSSFMQRTVFQDQRIYGT